jgi:hypothetical protein
MHSSEHSLYQLTALPRVVPWMSWDEWKQVYFWLFDPDPAIARQGLKRVSFIDLELKQFTELID